MRDDETSWHTPSPELGAGSGEHPGMGGQAGAAEVNALVFDTLRRECPLQRFYVAFDAPTEAT